MSKDVRVLEAKL